MIERSILIELSKLSAEAGSLLQQTLEEDSIGELNNLRRRLFNITTYMTKFSLQMCADDCGGLSEFIAFFTTLRNVSLYIY